MVHRGVHFIQHLFKSFLHEFRPHHVEIRWTRSAQRRGGKRQKSNKKKRRMAAVNPKVFFEITIGAKKAGVSLPLCVCVVAT